MTIDPSNLEVPAADAMRAVQKGIEAKNDLSHSIEKHTPRMTGKGPASQLSEARKVFDGILKQRDKGGVVKALEGDGEDGPEGEAKGAQKKATAAAGEREEERATSGEDPEEQRSVDDPSARDRLRLKLGLSEEFVSALDDDQTAELWSRVSGRETKIDQELRRNAELAKSIEKLRTTAGAEEPKGLLASKPDLAELKKRLSDELASEDAATALVDTLDGVLAPVLQELQSAKAQAAQAESAATATAVSRARDALGDRFPELPENFDRIQSRMAALAQDESYRDFSSQEKAFEALMRDAARSLGLREVPLGAPKKRASQPRATLRDSRSAKSAMTDEQRVRRLFDHLQKHPSNKHGTSRVADAQKYAGMN